MRDPNDGKHVADRSEVIGSAASSSSLEKAPKKMETRSHRPVRVRLMAEAPEDDFVAAPAAHAEADDDAGDLLLALTLALALGSVTTGFVLVADDGASTGSSAVRRILSIEMPSAMQW